MKRLSIHFSLLIIVVSMLASCNNTKKSANVQEEEVVEIPFSGDSAYAYCARQCEFGPRTMNSEAHERCGQWIAETFSKRGDSFETFFNAEGAQIFQIFQRVVISFQVD